MARNACVVQPILGKERGSEFGPPLPLRFRCVWVESLQDAQDLTSLATVTANIGDILRLDKGANGDSKGQ